MNLQTKITIAAPDFSIDYNSKLMMLGSCFMDRVSRKIWVVSSRITSLTWM